MEGKLLEYLSSGQLITWLIIAFLVGYFIYKEWPEFRKRVSSGAVKEQKESETDKSVDQRLGNIEQRLATIEEKLNNDYSRMNDLERESKRNRRMAEESLEEREIIMRALLGALGGLQELGANGVTHTAEAEIRDYLNRKAHDNEPVD